MRSVVTRIAVLLAGGMVIAVALLSNVWFSSVGVAAGFPSLVPSPGLPTTAVAAIETSRPTVPAVPSMAPIPTVVATPTVRPSEPPPVTPAPVTPVAVTPPPAPPPPRDEADDCPRPPSGVKLAPVLSHGNVHAKIVALTFDDGFNAANTSRILGILKRYHVNATFFPTGRAILESPAVWRDIAAARFPIGDHTFNHPTMSDLCYDAQVSELKRQAKAVRSALGIRVQPYMRPPYEAWNRTTRVATTAAGQRAVVIWNIDTKDWSGLPASTIARRALHGDNGAIVLMHTTAENTAIALPEIIARYRTRGFRFVTIGQMLGIDGPVPYN